MTRSHVFAFILYNFALIVQINFFTTTISKILILLYKITRWSIIQQVHYKKHFFKS